MNSQPTLSVRDLSKRLFIHESDQHIQAFSGVSFDSFSGHLVCLVGASGSGKSSVLKCIYRTYLATSGEARYRTSGGDSVNLVNASDASILRLRRMEIRLVSQFLKVLPRRTASQIVEHTLIEAYGASAEHPEAASEMLRHVGLPEKLWKLPPNTFSGGERQLVNLARALAVRPRLLLLDEPTASLDPAATERLLSLIERLMSEGLAIVAVFHDPEVVRRLAGQIVELTGGLNSPLPHGLIP